jgi:hypothetical protein
MHPSQTFSSIDSRPKMGSSATASLISASSAEQPSSAGFVAMLAAYRSTGGTARAEELANLLQDHQRGNYTSLARLIATGKVFSFEWRETHWVPMFQFDMMDLSIKPGPAQVVAELRDALDGWSMARWFAEPNAGLDGARPVDSIDARLQDVLNAARADRWVVTG